MANKLIKRTAGGDSWLVDIDKFFEILDSHLLTPTGGIRDFRAVEKLALNCTRHGWGDGVGSCGEKFYKTWDDLFSALSESYGGEIPTGLIAEIVQSAVEYAAKKGNGGALDSLSAGRWLISFDEINRIEIVTWPRFGVLYAELKEYMRLGLERDYFDDPCIELWLADGVVEWPELYACFIELTENAN